jgi:hypothetical protein
LGFDDGLGFGEPIIMWLPLMWFGLAFGEAIMWLLLFIE